MELVVVIAIIGILAGIAVPRFLDATASARGAKIVADMRTIQSAEMIYYAKNAKYPTQQSDLNTLVQGGWCSNWQIHYRPSIKTRWRYYRRNCSFYWCCI